MQNLADLGLVARIPNTPYDPFPLLAASPRCFKRENQESLLLPESDFTFAPQTLPALGLYRLGREHLLQAIHRRDFP